MEKEAPTTDEQGRQEADAEKDEQAHQGPAQMQPEMGQGREHDDSGKGPDECGM